MFLFRCWDCRDCWIFVYLSLGILDIALVEHQVIGILQLQFGSLRILVTSYFRVLVESNGVIAPASVQSNC